MNKQSEIKTTKTQRGVVVSDKADKTVTVLIDRIKTHRLYKKKYTMSQKFRAHDEENAYKIGDVVEIASTKPVSKDKHFKVIRKV
ncbi:MAG: 30S ribosomal protein S17 [bacterium ADurb.Bin400]|nr:MAG: 30S ribosomal protein S17 [bacterium ADurb.Bin400]